MVPGKALLVLGVLMAALLIISREATAREMAETTATEEQTSESWKHIYIAHA